MYTIIDPAIWIVPGLALLVVAWVRFNNPPTNRSGTTFFLFHLGMVFYYALLVALWFLVIILLKAGGIGLGGIGSLVGKAIAAPDQVETFIPILGVLIIAVASQFPKVQKLDGAARQLCISLAAIPREAEQLAEELAQRSEFEIRNPALKTRVLEELVESFGERNGTELAEVKDAKKLAYRFTRAISLYWLFVAPHLEGTPLRFPVSANTRSAYVKTMRLFRKDVKQASSTYEEAISAELDFLASKSQRQTQKNEVRQKVRELSSLVCGLIAHYVLIADKGASQRKRRLFAMGFDVREYLPPLGTNQWVAIVFAITMLFMLMSVIVPLRQQSEPVAAFSLSIMIALQLGIASIVGATVARRFIERSDGEDAGFKFPPIAELAMGALLVVGLCIALRFAWPLATNFLRTGTFSIDLAVKIFQARWPWVILPFICTVSTGVLCSYLGKVRGGWVRLGLVGALGNALAFGLGGLLIGQLLSDEAIARMSADRSVAILTIFAGTSFVGATLGALVVTLFRKSFKWKEETEQKGSVDVQPSTPLADVPSGDALSMHPIPNTETEIDYGGYSKTMAAELAGRYVCVRPTFSTPGVVNAYLIEIRWDSAKASLVFEEHSRYDKAHIQKGRVFLPIDKPFMSLVTVDRGAVRLIMVTRPDASGVGRGLILTLSNPSGVHFTPASAPIVLRRVGEETPQLGYVHPGSADYELYATQIGSVMPDYAKFSAWVNLHGEAGRLAMVGGASG